MFYNEYNKRKDTLKMPTKIGNYTLRLDHSPSVVGFAAVVGKKEGEGPLARYFDTISEDTTFGEQSWEKAESRMQKDAVNKALSKSSLTANDLDFIFAGDLLNQCIGTHYGLRELGVQFIGLYGACSTMAESLAMASLFVDSNIARKCVALTSSHFCSAERQFRFPLEYGGQRATTTQWTVTGAGCAIIGESANAPYIKAVTIGTIEDMGIKDINNMGAAMVPAAHKTITRFFEDTCTSPKNYDLIITGDLGFVGNQILCELLKQDGYDTDKKLSDCGMLIFDREKQDVHAGGSGCGCSASVMCSYIMDGIQKGKLNEVIFVATGALMSPTSVQQGESIPAIAHLIHLSSTKNNRSEQSCNKKNTNSTKSK